MLIATLPLDRLSSLVVFRLSGLRKRPSSQSDLSRLKAKSGLDRLRSFRRVATVYQDRAAAETDAIAQWIALGLSDGLTGQLTKQLQRTPLARRC